MKTEVAKARAKIVAANFEEVEALISSHPFFEGFKPEHLAALADCAMKTEFSRGQFIFREGERANRFYLILEGKVALEAQRPGAAPVVVENIGAGNVLGWSWLVEPQIWHFDARAFEPTKAIFFYGTWLRELYEENGNLGYEMLKRVAEVMLQRLQAARSRLLDSCAVPVPPLTGTHSATPKS